MILSSRTEPPLPLARYRARGQMIELRVDDLQFRLEETAVFMNESMELGLARQEIENLQAQLEGWAAGLRLAGLTMQHWHAEFRSRSFRVKIGILLIISVRMFSKVYRTTCASFLCKTSILDRLCASLCNAVTEQQDSQEMLETLERENMFLVALDNRREWYRYHPSLRTFCAKNSPAALQTRSPDSAPPRCSLVLSAGYARPGLPSCPGGA